MLQVRRGLKHCDIVSITSLVEVMGTDFWLG